MFTSCFLLEPASIAASMAIQGPEAIDAASTWTEAQRRTAADELLASRGMRLAAGDEGRPTPLRQAIEVEHEKARVEMLRVMPFPRSGGSIKTVTSADIPMYRDRDEAHLAKVDAAIEFQRSQPAASDAQWSAEQHDPREVS